jgi:hypothetical protein
MRPGEVGTPKRPRSSPDELAVILGAIRAGCLGGVTTRRLEEDRPRGACDCAELRPHQWRLLIGDVFAPIQSRFECRAAGRTEQEDKRRNGQSKRQMTIDIETMLIKMRGRAHGPLEDARRCTRTRARIAWACLWVPEQS